MLSGVVHCVSCFLVFVVHKRRGLFSRNKDIKNWGVGGGAKAKISASRSPPWKHALSDWNRSTSDALLHQAEFLVTSDLPFRRPILHKSRMHTDTCYKCAETFNLPSSRTDAIRGNMIEGCEITNQPIISRKSWVQMLIPSNTVAYWNTFPSSLHACCRASAAHSVPTRNGDLSRKTCHRLIAFLETPLI